MRSTTPAVSPPEPAAELGADARAVLDAVAVPIMLLNSKGTIVGMNEAARIVGCEAGVSVFAGVAPLDRATTRKALCAARDGAGAQAVVVGSPREIDHRARRGVVTRFCDGTGDVAFAVTLGCVTINGPESLDDLTGVCGRRRILDQLARRLAEARRYGAPLAIALLDLDRFKRVNDELGHSAGDSALRAATSAMVGRIRDTDDIGRIGGDEFLILLTAASGDDAGDVLREVCRRIGEVKVTGRGKAIRLSASAGIFAADPEVEITATSALEAADQALAVAKRGRGAVVLH